MGAGEGTGNQTEKEIAGLGDVTWQPLGRNACPNSFVWSAMRLFKLWRLRPLPCSLMGCYTIYLAMG